MLKRGLLFVVVVVFFSAMALSEGLDLSAQSCAPGDLSAWCLQTFNSQGAVTTSTSDGVQGRMSESDTFGLMFESASHVGQNQVKTYNLDYVLRFKANDSNGFGNLTNVGDPPGNNGFTVSGDQGPTTYIRDSGGSDPSNSVVSNGDPPAGPVPEPGSLVLLGSGLLGVAVLVRRKRRLAH